MRDTIMIVDDEPNILNALGRLFRREGVDVITAESGEAGLELIRKHQVAVVISDQRMPGIDGVEFLQRFMAVSPDTIRFMLTGYADMKSVLDAINRGEVYRFITKPWDDEQLKLVVGEALEKHRVTVSSKKLGDAIRGQYLRMLELNQQLGTEIETKTKCIEANFSVFIELCADMIMLHDRRSGEHARRVAMLAEKLALKLGNGEADAEAIRAAALLHTIGMGTAPDQACTQANEEASVSARTPYGGNGALSRELLVKMDTLNQQVSTIMRSYAERCQLDQYCDLSQGKAVHPGVKIIAVCKAYDELRHRSRPFSRSEALARIEAGRNKKYDPAVIDALAECVTEEASLL